jgi:hypothetical protein
LRNERKGVENRRRRRARRRRFGDSVAAFDFLPSDLADGLMTLAAHGNSPQPTQSPFGENFPHASRPYYALFRARLGRKFRIFGEPKIGFDR